MRIRGRLASVRPPDRVEIFRQRDDALAAPAGEVGHRVFEGHRFGEAEGVLQRVARRRVALDPRAPRGGAEPGRVYGDEDPRLRFRIEADHHVLAVPFLNESFHAALHDCRHRTDVTQPPL